MSDKLRSRRGARRALLLLVLPIIFAATGSGCAGLGVKPWERDQLARPSMQLDPNPTETGIDEHVYFSKEASSGGRGFGGGGCGCN